MSAALVSGFLALRQLRPQGSGVRSSGPQLSTLKMPSPLCTLTATESQCREQKHGTRDCSGSQVWCLSLHQHRLGTRVRIVRPHPRTVESEAGAGSQQAVFNKLPKEFWRAFKCGNHRSRPVPGAAAAAAASTPWFQNRCSTAFTSHSFHE